MIANLHAVLEGLRTNFPNVRVDERIVGVHDRHLSLAGYRAPLSPSRRDEEKRQRQDRIHGEELYAFHPVCFSIL